MIDDGSHLQERSRKSDCEQQRFLTGKARLAGVIGQPISHSRSPRLHGYWLCRYSIDGAYVPMEVAPAALERAVAGLQAVGFVGVNVTLPHKESALRCATQITQAARRIGAANVLSFLDGGAIVADNTDAYGFVAHLQSVCPDWREPATIHSATAMVLGAGGAARAIVVALQQLQIGKILLCNRSESRAQLLAAELGGAIECVSWDDREESLSLCRLLVNATALGMRGQAPLSIQLAELPADAVVYDIVYDPLQTPLLAEAHRLGIRTVDGLGMLIHQARPAFHRFFGIDPEVDAGIRPLLIG